MIACFSSMRPNRRPTEQRKFRLLIGAWDREGVTGERALS
jgi:hypothetical protein